MLNPGWESLASSESGKIIGDADIESVICLVITQKKTQSLDIDPFKVRWVLEESVKCLDDTFTVLYTFYDEILSFVIHPFKHVRWMMMIVGIVSSNV